MEKYGFFFLQDVCSRKVILIDSTVELGRGVVLPNPPECCAAAGRIIWKQRKEHAQKDLKAHN